MAKKKSKQVNQQRKMIRRLRELRTSIKYTARRAAHILASEALVNADSLKGLRAFSDDTEIKAKAFGYNNIRIKFLQHGKWQHLDCATVEELEILYGAQWRSTAKLSPLELLALTV